MTDAAPIRGRTALAVLVAVLAVTGGCAGLLGDDTTPAEVTPAPVPTAAPTVAPGVTADETIDVDSLVTANNRILATRSHRVDRTVTVVRESGTVRLRRVQQVAENRTALARMTATVSGPIGSVAWNWTRYRGSRFTYSRAVQADGRRVINRMPSNGTDSFSMGRDLAGRVLSAGTYRTRPLENGTVLTSTNNPDLGGDLIPATTVQPRNASVRLRVSESGLIRNLTIAYEATRDSRTVRVRLAQQVTGLGETTAGPPQWVADRRNASG